ncbi:DUF397 domain-containing protein [Actinomadura sp. 7K507]|uniref:DUF397 domain-containing protein n=1 Tax=Actinomadura sp. 7K507 TaxID=2530365 RepID=UPI00104826B3|nr:DUF397 domain-containing protein [Actinomadura sp. 7K507]TDC84782.1 DUF397 domain-containing protein [Actinomadura sp. 7K507]
MRTDLSHAVWRKAFRSTVQNDNCVEIADVPNAVVIRDSKDPGGATLIMSRSSFRDFANTLKDL